MSAGNQPKRKTASPEAIAARQRLALMLAANRTGNRQAPPEDWLDKPLSREAFKEWSPSQALRDVVVLRVARSKRKVGADRISIEVFSRFGIAYTEQQVNDVRDQHPHFMEGRKIGDRIGAIAHDKPSTLVMLEDSK